MKLLLAAGCLLFVTAAALADPQSQSYSSWKLYDDQLRMRYTVSAREVSRLSHSNEQKALEAALLAHLSATVSISIADSPCAVQLPGRIRAAKTAYVVAELLYKCDTSTISSEPLNPMGPLEPLRVSIGAFFDQAPSHIHFARFALAEKAQQELLFTQHQRLQSISWESGALNSASLEEGALGSAQEQEFENDWLTVQAYLVLGFQHILEGADHIVFLLALLLLVNSARDILLIVTGFTLGHSITLSLAALNIVQANTALVESMIGLSIALVAVENVAARSAHRRAIVWAASAGLLLLAVFPIVLSLTAFSTSINLPIKSPPTITVLGLALFCFCYLSLSESPQRAMRYRPAITMLFGLIHGFGFANVLQEVGIPTTRVPAALFGFNVGVELGQLAIVLCLSGVGFVLLRLLKNGNRVFASELLSAVLCAVGTYWFVQRAYV